MSDLDALIERVEAATGPDREIDAVVWRVVLMPQLPFYREFDGRVMLDVRHGLGEGGPDWRHPSPYDQSRYPPNYTASLDAALTLMERKLPGWMVVNLSEWENERMRARGRWMAQLKPIGAQGDLRVVTAYCQHAPSPALALISALLRALKSEEGKE